MVIWSEMETLKQEMTSDREVIKTLQRARGFDCAGILLPAELPFQRTDKG